MMATLRDVAEAAGVSTRTASRTLKRDGPVARETRERVLKASRELKYVPDPIARSLRTRRSTEIAAASFSFDELYITRLAGLEEGLRRRDYTLTVHFPTTMRDWRQLLGRLPLRLPGGLVLLGKPSPRHLDALRSIWASRTPIAIIDTNVSDVHTVVIDRQQGFAESVRFLHSRGRRRVAYAGPDHAGRVKGYRRAVTELGLETFLFDAPYKGSQVYELGCRLARRIAKHSPRIDAVQAYSDELAMGLLSEFYRLRVRVPADVAVVGFDDRRVATMATPPLTTLAQPSMEIGRRAAEVVLEDIDADGARLKPRRIVVLPKLVVREST